LCAGVSPVRGIYRSRSKAKRDRRYLALGNDEPVRAVIKVVETAHTLSIPTLTDTPHHNLNPGGPTLEEAFGLSPPTREDRGARLKLHFSNQNPEEQASSTLTLYILRLAALVGRRGGRRDGRGEGQGTPSSRWA
jgi:UV DNA damage repair endonuclease